MGKTTRYLYMEGNQEKIENGCVRAAYHPFLLLVDGKPGKENKHQADPGVAAVAVTAVLTNNFGSVDCAVWKNFEMKIAM